MTSRHKKIASYSIAACIVALAFAGIFLLLQENHASDGGASLEKIRLLGSIRADWYHARGTTTETEARIRAKGGSDAVHLLFLGVDRRKNEQGRADAIHLLRFEPGRITLFSMPRDCLYSSRGDTIADKLNHTYGGGGAQATRRAIEALLKIKIDGHMEVDLQTFAHAAQIANTVTLGGRLIGAEKIFSHIDGLLSWLRNRSFAGGDLRRIARHHLFIQKSLDWTLTLYRDHPSVFNAVVNGTLNVLPNTLSTRQVMMLSQIYSTQPGSDPVPHAGDTDIVNPAVRSMERFIMPGQAVIIDRQSGLELAPPGDTRNVTLSETMVWHVWRGQAEKESEQHPGAPALPAETGVLSFYRIKDRGLDALLADWRAKGLRQNYEDKDELLN